MFEIYLYSGSVHRHFTAYESEKEAKEFCEHYNYEWEDSNCFVWNMDYRFLPQGNNGYSI